MKCPRCGYLGFEKAERCRNCGHDFALAPPPLDPDLALRNSDRVMQAAIDLDLMHSASQPRASAGAAARRPIGSNVTSNSIDELPLFRPESLDEVADDVPLITQASPPRPPLAVRRSTPEVPRPRGEPGRTPHLEFPEGAFDAPSETTVRPAVKPTRSGPAIQAPLATSEPAGLVARFLASVIDLSLLGIVDLIVIYFTVQICGLSFSELSLLPIGPLVAFLIVQNGSYLVAFTAGGQTIGKMALGIRVVPAAAGTTLDLGRSLIRTGVWSLLVLPAGLGLLTAFLSDDRQGLHDRFAGTRVVRATPS